MMVKVGATVKARAREREREGDIGSVEGEYLRNRKKPRTEAGLVGSLIRHGCSFQVTIAAGTRVVRLPSYNGGMRKDY